MEINPSLLKKVSDFQADGLYFLGRISWEERCRRIYGDPIVTNETDAECAKMIIAKSGAGCNEEGYIVTEETAGIVIKVDRVQIDINKFGSLITQAYRLADGEKIVINNLELTNKEVIIK